MEFKTVGERLREIRGDMSREEFVPYVGVSKSTLARYERGSRSPDAEFIGLLLENFGINPVWFIYGTDQKYLSSNRLTHEGHSPGKPTKLPSIDHELLREIIEGVEESLTSNELELSTEKKAQIISLLYEHFTETGKEVDEQTVTRYLRLGA